AAGVPHVVAEEVEARETGTCAELASEVIAHDDDARFDLHLADRNVERSNQPTDVFQAVGRILQQQRVGALIDRDRATLGEQSALTLSLDQCGQIRSLGIVDLQVFGTQRRKLLYV